MLFLNSTDGSARTEDKTTEVRGCADFSVMFAEKLNKNN